VAAAVGWVVVGAVVGGLVTWAVSYFMPGVYRHVTRRPSLHVHIEADRSVIWAGAPPWVTYGFMIESPDGLGEPPSSFCPDWWAWARALGAVDANETEVQLTFTAATDTTVVIDAFTARVAKRADPLPWTLVQCTTGGADLTKRGVQIDLDSFDPPTTHFVDREHEIVRGAPTISVGPGEAEMFHVRARARSSYVEWTAEARLIVNGKRQVVRIDDNGKPFRTCSSNGRPERWWTGGRWTPRPTTGLP
jgi:hypothetical protein